MQLDTFGTATVSAAGIATVTIPIPRNERWTLRRYSVLTNQSPTLTTIPIATVYTNSISDGNALDSTFTGSRDSGDCDVTIEGGGSIIAQWTGGIAGTIATLSIYGDKVIY